MIEVRGLIFINTDPQRRCYNGCHKSGEYIWSPWTELDSNDDNLNWWVDLNNYAVNERGKSARKEFRIIE